MKLFGFGFGTAVWDSGCCLKYECRRGGDLAFFSGRNGNLSLLSLENRFGRMEKNRVPHALRWLEVGSYRELGEIEIMVPTGGVEFLELNPAATTCCVTWLDQTEWGYVLIDVERRSQLKRGEAFFPSPSFEPPQFTPDGSQIVACHSPRSGWWTDEFDDYWDHPSRGGCRKAGRITVHNLLSDTISSHDVLLHLPVGFR